MEAIECLRTRRSVRSYRPDPVSREDLETIVDCGRLAPTGRGEQPWEFVVVTDKAMREKIAAITSYGKFIAQAPACIAVLCRDTTYYVEDGSAATTNILNAARALGLGSCWVAGDKKPYAAEIAGMLGAPAGIRLVALVAIGHTDECPAPRKRGLDEVLHWERIG